MKKAITIITLTIVSFAVRAQIPRPDPDTTVQHFLIVASISNLQEVSAGELAAQKAKNTTVRSFGQTMVKDHGQEPQQLLQLAKSRGYNLPAAATSGIQPDLNLKKAGANFDQLYLHAMVTGHSNTVQTFETYATTGKDPVVKAFARQTLPTLQSHLAAVKALDENLKNQPEK